MTISNLIKFFQKSINIKLVKKEEIQMNNTTLKLSIQTLSRLNKFISLAYFSLLALLFVAPAYAEDVWFGGRLKAGNGVFYDRLDDTSGQ